MAVIQPEVGNVIAFFPRAALSVSASDASCLTPRDRMEATGWHDAARVAGYDRLVIHNRDCGDAQEVGSFLSVYRRGESWSRWGFARDRGKIRAWCCLSGADVGEFASLGEALASVLNGMAPDRQRKHKISAVEQADHRSAVVTEMASRLKSCRHSMGSAA